LSSSGQDRDVCAGCSVGKLMSRTFSREDLADEVLNPRLQREAARTGEITASLLWNGKSDLDLHAKVNLASGNKEEIWYSRKQGTGGKLDVDANARDSEVINEPVENIYWDEPPAGHYSIDVHNYRTRGHQGKIHFRCQLKLPTDTLDYEGTLGNKERVTCFRFIVDESGVVTLSSMALSKIMKKPSSAALMRSSMRTVKAKKKAMKAMKVVKVMKVMKVMKVKKAMKTKIAHGKRGRSAVYSGKFEKTSSGLKKEHFVKNKDGKIVSKKKHALGVKAYSQIKAWVEACKAARLQLGMSGFVAVKKGTALYTKAKELYQV